jgi:hypothetical protein
VSKKSSLKIKPKKMNAEFKYHAAVSITVRTKEASYGVFCFNEAGDLFINAECGFFYFTWKAYGQSFSKFLLDSKPESIVEKLSITYQEISKKKITEKKAKDLVILITLFLQELSRQINHKK